MQPISPGFRPMAVLTKRDRAVRQTSFAIVGTGWRSSVYLRMAYLMPERFRVSGLVARRAEAGAEVERDWGVATHRSIDALLGDERPDFVILSVPWSVTPELVRRLVSEGVHVLAETPPAVDLAGLHALWADVGASDLVQVAEQYPLMPLHAARLAVVDDGLIGTPSSVLVSSTHLYHAVALMRLFLHVDAETPVHVSASSFDSTLVDPITPRGWTHDREAKPVQTILASLDFGDGRMGRYDFTDNQWWNPVRPDHLLVRGSTGEIADETVTRMIDEVTPVSSRLERHSSGIGMDFEGLDLTHLTLDGRVLFRNEFEGARLSDDDIGVAVLLDRMGAWVRGEGAAPYPLREGCQDHAVALAIEEALGAGARVSVPVQPWA